MEEKEQELFRKKAMEQISSPDQLGEYLRVTSPGIWAILSAVMLLLAGIIAWSAAGTLETVSPVTAEVKDRNAVVVPVDGAVIADGMVLRINSHEYEIYLAAEDDYGRPVGYAETSLPDGKYQGTVVTETVRPIDFLLGSR